MKVQAIVRERLTGLTWMVAVFMIEGFASQSQARRAEVLQGGPVDAETVRATEPPEDANIWVAKAPGNASDPSNWSKNRAPEAGDHILLGSASNEAMTWDAAATDVVASWTQETAYTNTVVFATTYAANGFPLFTIAGDATLDGGAWTHCANGAFEVYRLRMHINGNLVVGTNASINCDSKGYASGKYPSGSQYSHGDQGGNANCKTYGSIYTPTNCGAGGNNWTGGHNAGGGAIYLTVSGAAQIQGAISSDSMGYPYLDGRRYTGAGGSVYLAAATLSGIGRISATAGNCYYNDVGGGGRIAIVLTQTGADYSAFTGTILARGGTWNLNGNPGTAGTVYLRKGGEAIDRGTLVIDNLTVDPNGNYKGTSLRTILRADSAENTFGDVIIRGQGCLQIEAGQTLRIAGSVSNAVSEAHLKTYGFGFDQGSGTVELIDTSTLSTVYGFSCFPSLKCTTPGKNIRFEPANSQSVKTRLELIGSPAYPVLLRSLVDASAWKLALLPVTVQSIDCVDVKDSSALSGEAVAALRSHDSGNNDNWVFSAVGETNTWTGTTSAAWGASANWSLSRTPMPTDRVVIPDGRPRNPVQDLDREVASLEIENGASLSLNNYNLAVSDDLRVNGRLLASGHERLRLTATNIVFAADAFSRARSTVVLDGAAAQRIVASGNAFWNLICSNTTATTTFADSAIVETFRNESGDLAFLSDISLGGFVCNDHAAAVTISVAPAKTISIRNLALRGDAWGLTFQSGTPGSAFRLAVSASADVRGISVSDCNALPGETVHAMNSTDTGRNANWDFSSTWAVWTGAFSTNFATPDNWSPAVVLGANTRVVIDSVANVCVITEAVSVKSLVVGGSAAAFVRAMEAFAVDDDILVRGGATLSLNRPSTVGCDVTIANDAVLMHESNGSTEANKLDVAIGGDFHLDESGIVDGCGKGYSGNNGPAANYVACHGGLGGNLNCTAISTYGSIYAPTNCGAGGLSAMRPGGGAIHLVITGDAIVNGRVDAGAKGFLSHSTGAGGSIWIEAKTLSGSGDITADGGHDVYHNAKDRGRLSCMCLSVHAFAVHALLSAPSESVFREYAAIPSGEKANLLDV